MKKSFVSNFSGKSNRNKLKIILFLMLSLVFHPSVYGQFRDENDPVEAELKVPKEGVSAAVTRKKNSSKLPTTYDLHEQLGSAGCNLVEPLTQGWECGARIRAGAQECKNMRFTFPVPAPWPEQEIKVVSEDISTLANVTFQEMSGGGKLAVVFLKSIPAQGSVNVLLKMSVTTSVQELPADVSHFMKPTLEQIPVGVRQYLKASPKIETQKPALRKLKDIGASEATAWKEVEAVYDWVRKTLEYKNGPQKGAVAALKDKTGDCEEFAAVFVGICRVKGIPARTVWVPDHCYAEFYLVDKTGKGFWFPCQIAGEDHLFGEMPMQYIILQKGDNFKSPLTNKFYSYLPQEIKILSSKGTPPRVEWVLKKANVD